MVFAGYLILGVVLSLSAQERPHVLGLSHIALKVSDVDKARAFYRDFLGFAEQGQLTNKDGSLLLVFLKVNDEQFLYDPDGTRIEFMEPKTVDGASVPPSEAPWPE